MPENKEEWQKRYRESIRLLADVREQGIAAGIYTQTTDVEGEINGLISYDRKVRKVPAEWLREVHVEAGLATPDVETPDVETRDVETRDVQVRDVQARDPR